MARIRAAEWESEDYWRARIAGYMRGELDPKEALAPRVVYAATGGAALEGFIAGHLTRRFDCHGEVEWIDVVRERRRTGIASGLLRMLAEWFVDQEARRICADPGNAQARRFYEYHGATELNKHWMVWNDISSVLEGTAR